MIRLSIKSLNAFIRNNPYVFAIMCLGIIISVYQLFLFAGLAYAEYENSIKFDTYKPANQVSIELRDTTSTDDIYSLLEEIKNYVLMPPISNIRASVDFDYTIIGIDYRENIKAGIITRGRFFKNDEVKNAEHIAIVSESYRSTLDKKALLELPNSLLQVAGKKYEVVGCYTSFINYTLNEIAIPLNTYINDNLPVLILTITYTERLKTQESEYIAEELAEISFITKVVLPDKYNIKELFDLALSSVKYYVLVLLSFICTLNLTNYWLKKQNRRFTVYTICGASSMKIIIIAMLSMIFITLFSVMIAYILFKLTSPYLISNNVIADAHWAVEVGQIALLLCSILLFTYIAGKKLTKSILSGVKTP